MIRHGHLLVVLVAWSLCAAQEAGPVSDSGQVSSVYFQVSYANGDVRDLSSVPTTNKGILSVTRFTRIESPGRDVRVISTHGRPGRGAGTVGRTLIASLIWNSKAWVAPAPKTKPAPAAATTRPVSSQKEELRALEMVLAELRRIETTREGGVAASERKLASSKDEPQRKTAQAELDKARAKLAKCRSAIAAAEDKLVLLVSAGQVAAGTLSTSPPVKTAGTAPLAVPKNMVTESGVFSHRVQVWPLAVGKGKRGVSVAIAHAEAGAFGEFYFVAYADTNGDGGPDRLIAKSALAQANQPGQWSTWTFTTDQKRVFVGNTWPRAEASHFRRRRGRRSGKVRGHALPDEVYISRRYGAVPSERRQHWPYLHNIRIRLKPAAQADDSEPEMIIEHR